MSDAKRVTIPTADLEAAMERWDGPKTNPADLVRWMVKRFGQGRAIFPADNLDLPRDPAE